MNEIDAIRPLFPTWIAWLPTVVLAACALFTQATSLWLTGWLFRDVAKFSGPWPEHARLVHNTRHVRTVASLAAILGFVVPVVDTGGPLHWPTGVTVTIIVASGLVCRDLFAWRFHRQLCGGSYWTLRRWLRARATETLLIWQLFWIPLLVVAIAPGRFCLEFWAIYVPAMALMTWLATGGGVRSALACGLARPPNQRLAGILARAAERADHPIRRAIVIPMTMANAFAWRREQAVGFTERALEVLDDEQILAIALHEIGHLREPATRKRLLALAFFMLLAAVLPVADAIGWVGFAVVMLATLFLVRIAIAATARFEQHADDHAHEHVEDSAVYARALERLHRANLVPAVLPGKRKTHPDLYDRMLAAGVTPDYPRPAPPGRRVRALLIVVWLSVCFGAVYIPDQSVRRSAWENEAAARRCIIWSGGEAWSFTALANVVVDSRPAESELLLRAAIALQPDWPLYHARLASTLLELGQRSAASDALATARRLYVSLEEPIDWLENEIQAVADEFD